MILPSRASAIFQLTQFSSATGNIAVVTPTLQTRI